MSWPVHSLGSLIESDGGVLQTGPFGSQLKQAEYTSDGVPVIMPTDIENGEVNERTVARVPETTVERLSRHKIRAGGIVLPRRGAITKRAFIRPDQEGWLCGTGCIKIELNGLRIWPRYLYYYLGLKNSVDWLERNAVGSTMLNLSAEIVSRFPMVCPSIPTQRRIADMLSAYDELIENNRRRIALLEQAARELYREWFVRLRFPGHENTRIVDGLPEGWERRTITDVCTSFDDGDWIETKDQGGKDFRLLQISNIGNNEFLETRNYRWITSETFRSLRCNEVLPGDILISRMPKPIGRAWLVYEQRWRMITAVDVTIARPDQSAVDFLYYLYHLNSQMHIARCELRATGATRPRISRKTMGELPIFRPPMTLQLTFGQIASAINEQRNTLAGQNKVVSQARDLLLPRLMSGEVGV